MSTPSARATRAAFRAAAEQAGWVYSPAHGGWIHPDEYDPERGYHVQFDAEDACWLHDIVPDVAMSDADE